MSLAETLATEMKAAMKARARDRLDAIRLLRAEVQKAELKKGGDLAEAEELDLLSRMAKQRRESIDAFRAGGRDELADKEAFELALIEGYLPSQLTADEVRAMAEAVVAEVGASKKSEMGKVMGKLMPQLKGRFPGKDVGPIVQSLLD